MPSTLAQKLVAHACGRATVELGEIVTCRVDLAMFHDSSGPRRLKPMLEELGADIWDKSKVVLVIDHYVPEADDESRRIVRIARDWAAEQQLPYFYDSQGICHVTSAGISIHRPAVRSAPTCSASARPRCSAWSSPARSGCACRRRSSCSGTDGFGAA